MIKNLTRRKFCIDRGGWNRIHTIGYPHIIGKLCRYIIVIYVCVYNNIL